MPPRALTPALAAASAKAVTPTRTGIPVAAGTTTAVNGRNAATLTNYNYYYSYIVHGQQDMGRQKRKGRNQQLQCPFIKDRRIF
jgi:hypothetical protein